ncbi:MAG: hypothetical protein JRD64_04655, partial [Deltaproteobacteria bacterium]|nr:hypothetical protein [Deltaproteobacteria bacterium]
DCDQCHTDPRLTYNGGVNIAYKQLLCANCHVVDDGGSGRKAVRFQLKDPGDGANSTRAGNTQSDIANHAWPNTSAINNYGACFYCHGQSGVAAGRATNVTLPLHAMPQPTDKDTGADVGTAFVRDVNLMGGGGWQKDSYSGTSNTYGAWSIDKTKAGGLDYRGGEGVVAAGDWDQAYFPLGKTVYNIAWAAYSQPKQAAKNTVYSVNNSALLGDSKWNVMAGLKWGYVSDIPHSGNGGYFMPIMDDAASLASLGVDTLSQNTAFGITWVPDSETGPYTSRTITVDISSNDSSATLSLIYGGIILATGSANGTLSTTVNLDTEATNIVGSASKEDLFHSNRAGVFWVASDKGGSIVLQGHALQVQTQNP